LRGGGTEEGEGENDKYSIIGGRGLCVVGGLGFCGVWGCWGGSGDLIAVTGVSMSGLLEKYKDEANNYKGNRNLQVVSPQDPRCRSKGGWDRTPPSATKEF